MATHTTVTGVDSDAEAKKIKKKLKRFGILLRIILTDI